MNSVRARRLVELLLACWCVAAACPAAALPAAAQPEADREWRNSLAWVRGVNYIPSHVATGVECWQQYDHDVVDRELGYAQKIGLNSVRVMLQSLVYESSPDDFLKHFEDFLATADRHGLKVIPVLFNSSLGAAPSLESRHMWVGNPGPDRMGDADRPALDAYVTAVVTTHVDDSRILLWDVVSEPQISILATHPDGREQIQAFVSHYCKLVRKLDTSHPITVGVSTWDNSAVIDLVDVLSCHSYAASRTDFHSDVQRTRDQARVAGKPWIVSECGAPAWGNHYEMIMPVLREFQAGYTLFALMIGRDEFAGVAGLFYPDGMVRRRAQIEAVTDAPAAFLREKPDGQGVPIAKPGPDRLREYVRYAARNAVTEATWRERNTLAQSLIWRKTYGDDAQRARDMKRLETVRTLYANNDQETAFATLGELLNEMSTAIAAAPDVDTTPATQKAVIYRDVYGVPHIYADTEPAGAYALALVQCEDNAQQVFDSLLSVSGRSAERLGEGQAKRDRICHLWRLPEISENAWNSSTPRTRRMIRAYCDGLNDYRKEHPDECLNSLAATPAQVFGLAKMILLEGSVTILNVDVEQTLASQQPPMFPTGQSSTFAIGPSRTATGKPILLIDPHWPADGVQSFYEYHLHVGRTDVGGFAITGLPFVGLGYTNRVAWAMTSGGADSADAFELAVNPANANQYWFDGAWKDMEVRTIEISVVKAGKLETRELTLRESVHGPIFREQEGRTFAGAVCGWKDTRCIEEFLHMNRAGSKKEFLDAVRMDQVPWQNLCYATADGDIGYIQLGCCPVRRERPGLFAALDGTRSSALWSGVVPLDELPQVHNPETGWLQSCNTAASEATSGLKMTPEDFPPGALFGHFPFNGPVWRGRRDRCFQVLPKLTDCTLDDAHELAFETFAPVWPLWKPLLIMALDKYAPTLVDPGRDLQMAAEVLRNWDGRTDRDSVGHTVFRFWREEYAKTHPEAFGDNQANGAPKTEEEQADAVKALEQATVRLKQLYGTVQVPWGQVLRLRRNDLDVALEGSGTGPYHCECMRSTGAAGMTEDGHLVFDGGQVMTTLVEFTTPITVQSVVPFGQSHKPGHPHATDQMKLFATGRTRPAWHDWSSLRQHVETSRTVEYPPHQGG